MRRFERLAAILPNLALIIALVLALLLLAGAYAAPASAPAAASASAAPRPNIVVILLDDVGYADPSGFGGVAATPVFDRVAAGGLRFTQFHTVGMCSPTRAALLAGRNHHAVGFGRVADWASAAPGYDAVWKPEAASIARLLRGLGYRTAAVGKWHNTPEWEVSPAGPFERWPTGLGFDYFYGIMNHGGDNQWEPASLYRNTSPVEPPARPGQPYHLTEDFVDDAIRWVHTQQAVAPERPYFLYLATGATHAPHQVPASWIADYRGRFDQGWDRLREQIFARQRALGIVPADAVLTPRPAEIPAWASIGEADRAVFARQAEVFAGFLAHTDRQIGRLLDVVQGDDAAGRNTLVFYIAGDNGASGMEGLQGHLDGSRRIEDQRAHLHELGGPLHFNDYSAAWAWVGSTPFRWMKEVASHLGGLRVAMAASWPAGLARPGRQVDRFTHANDLVPTLLELLGATLPARVDGVAQRPLDGVSFADAFGPGPLSAPPRVQYFEMLGNRALYADGWLASARHMTPWLAPPSGFDDERWELYDLAHDFSQAHDLAAQQPQRLAAMRRQFDAEAQRNGVLPLQNFIEGQDHGMPTVHGGRRAFDFVPPLERLPTKVLPRLNRTSFTLTAEVDAGALPPQGMLMAYGSRLGGFAWYVQDGRLVFANNVYGRRQTVLAERPLPPGPARLELQVRRSADGTATLAMTIDGQPAGGGRVERLGAPVLGSLGIGRAYTSPISDDYALPFAFSGRLARLRLRLD
ncbi:MAG: arylsulfatase [Proteobacteria bacterium]|nr:arylsulfatase [Pseudomonadota bacterium]